MKVRLEVDGEPFDVDVERGGPDVRVECEGERRSLRTSPGSAAVRFAEGERIHTIEFQDDSNARLDGTPVRFHVVRFTPGGPAGARGHGRIPVSALMHGRIAKIVARAGHPVAKGDALFILEAMKMQNELASPADGVLRDVAVQEGDVVESGRVLAYLAPPEKPG